LKGGYALILYVCRGATIMTGRQTFTINPGIYIYSGSALGPGGIEARVRRHLRRFEWGRGMEVSKGVGDHWHIDYLLPLADSLAVAYAASESRSECLLIGILKERGLQVVEGFGNMDCGAGCGGHLLYMPGNDTEATLRVVVEALKKLGIKPSGMLVEGSSPQGARSGNA